MDASDGLRRHGILDGTGDDPNEGGSTAGIEQDDLAGGDRGGGARGADGSKPDARDISMQEILHRLTRTETLLTTLSTHVSQLAKVVLQIQKAQRSPDVDGNRNLSPRMGGEMGASPQASATGSGMGSGLFSPSPGTISGDSSQSGNQSGIDLANLGLSPTGILLPSNLMTPTPPIQLPQIHLDPSISISSPFTAPASTSTPVNLTTSLEIANLTTQISALSASVAQLQRLQTQGQGRSAVGQGVSGSSGGHASSGMGYHIGGAELGGSSTPGNETGPGFATDRDLAFQVQMPNGHIRSPGGRDLGRRDGKGAPGRMNSTNGTYIGVGGGSLPVRTPGSIRPGGGGPMTPGKSALADEYMDGAPGLRGRPYHGAQGISTEGSSLNMNHSAASFPPQYRQPLLSPAAGSLSQHMLLSGLGSPNISSLVNGAAASQAGLSLAPDWTTSSPQSAANQQQLAAALMGMTMGPPDLANASSLTGGLGIAGMGSGMISPGPSGFVRESGPQTPGGTKDLSGTGVWKWESLALAPDLLRQIAKYGIGPPNKIQSRSLPFMLRGSDVIAQAPPTQERIITYVIPIIQLCLTLGLQQTHYKGPSAVIVTTTVDQANQAHKLLRDLGSPLGIRAQLAVGAVNADITNDLKTMHQNSVQVVIGTPGRVHDIFVKRAGSGGLSGAEVQMLVLDEVDQLIARNLYEYVLALVKVLPAARNRGRGPSGTTAVRSPGVASPYDAGMQSPFNPASTTPFPTPGKVGTLAIAAEPVARQTCIFSNTIPTDVINFSQSIQVREPVRVLVRREGANSNQNDSSTAGNLRHYYLYLALAGNVSSSPNMNRNDTTGPGTIGSGRAASTTQVINGTGSTNSEANQAKEWKLNALADILADYPLWQAIVHVGSPVTQEAVVAKLRSRQMETISLNADMSPAEKQIAIAKWKVSAHTQRGARFLIVLDLVVKGPEVVPAPLVVNFDLPRSVEGYAQRVVVAAQPQSQPSNDRDPNSRRTGREREQSQSPLSGTSVILNFIQAAGGDVEMLRSIECAFRLRVRFVVSGDDRR